MSPDKNRPDWSDDPRTYFAAERTLLAWVRTGLAMMGFGFVVARFGLFLRELAAEQGVPAQQRLSASLWVGTTLVLLGVAVNLLAALKHMTIVRRLDRGQPIRFGPLSLGIVVAVLLGMLGLLIAAYLVFGLTTPNELPPRSSLLPGSPACQGLSGCGSGGSLRSASPTLTAAPAAGSSACAVHRMPLTMNRRNASISKFS
jgi:putative membrane protein